MTFDGKRYNFMGVCSYYMMYSPDFEVIINNMKCGHGPVSCTDSLTININQHTIKVGQDHQLLVDGTTGTINSFPYTDDSIKIHMVSSLFMKVFS